MKNLASEALTYLNKNRLINLNMIYVINTYLDIIIYMDNKYEGVAIRQNNTIYIYSNSYEFISKYLDSIDYDYIIFSAVADECMKLIMQYLKIKNIELNWSNPCHLYCYLLSEIDISLIKNKTANIEPDDCGIIDEHYTYKGEGSLDRIKAEVNSGVSSCIKINGELASWSVTHGDGSMGIMYTLEKYRGLGLAKDVSIDLINKQLKLGLTPFIHIVVGNTPSINLARKLEFKEIGLVHWCGIDKSL